MQNKKELLVQEYESEENSRNVENLNPMRRIYSVTHLKGNERIEPQRLSTSMSKQMYSFSKSSRAYKTKKE